MRRGVVEERETYKVSSRRGREKGSRRGEGERRGVVEVRGRDAESSIDQQLIPLDFVEERVRYDEYTDNDAD